MKREGRVASLSLSLSPVYGFRQDLGCIIPFASPKALLQLALTRFPLLLEDANLMSSNSILVQGTLALQLKLTAISDFDVPYIFE